MAFRLNDDESLDDEEYLEEFAEQVSIHKDNILNSRVEVVEEVAQTLLITILENVDKEFAKAVLPILTAFNESITELKIEIEQLRGEIIEKKTPPPNDFEIN